MHLDLDGMISVHLMLKNMNTMKELKMEIATGSFHKSSWHLWGQLRNETHSNGMGTTPISM